MKTPLNIRLLTRLRYARRAVLSGRLLPETHICVVGDDPPDFIVEPIGAFSPDSGLPYQGLQGLFPPGVPQEGLDTGGDISINIGISTGTLLTLPATYQQRRWRHIINIINIINIITGNTGRRTPSPGD